MSGISRRGFLRATALGGASLAAGLTLPFGGALAQGAQARWANLVPGFTTLVTDYIIANKLASKHGVNLAEPKTYTSVPTYYADFVAGSYDLCIGSWDTFAGRYVGGVPLQLVCTITTADMINIVARKDGPQSVTDLKGKILAAPQSTGTYLMTRALIRELLDMDLESAMTVQNVTNPAASVTLAMAGRADAALSWEPNISRILLEKPEFRILFNAGKEYRARHGIDLPYFSVAIRKSLVEKDPGIAGRVNQMFKACLDGIAAEPEEAIRIAGERTGTPPEVMRTALSTGRLAFKHGDMSKPEARKTVEAAAEFMLRNKLLKKPIDDGFFAA